MKIGDVIKELRRINGISLRELSDRTDFYVSFLASIEENTTVPTSETVVKICRTLNAPEVLINFLSINKSQIPAHKEILFNTLSPVILELFVDLTPKDQSYAEELTNMGDTNEPLVFISYSWDDDAHRNWVREFADDLIKNGVKVIIDTYDLRLGGNRTFFMERSVEEADFVLVIFTPAYRDKSNKRTGGAGYEYTIINQELYENMSNNKKIIPILRRGSINDSIPSFIKQYIVSDFTDDSLYGEKLDDVLRLIYNEPKQQRPLPGSKPKFS